MIINEFTARKLGEVLAFSRVGAETWERGKSALVSVFGEATASQTQDSFETHALQIEELARSLGVAESTLPKAESTSKKLRDMRDLYVGEAWDNPAELLEWFGFFEGAAIVHWNLVMGAAEAINNITLTELALTGLDCHSQLLKQITDKIKTIGSQKAQ